jgi:hypothetical protein
MARINSFTREVKLWVSENMSPAARQKLAATMARKLLGEAQAQNKKVLGKVPPHKQVVDGRIGAPLESVNPDRGRILFEFELVTDLLAWIGEQLVLHSPVGTAPEDPHPGLYQRSHRLLADGVEINPDGKIPQADEYLFINIQPYARKIERGHSSQAPEGVYEVVADLARRRFGNIARIRYTMVGISDSGASSLWDWAAANASRQEGEAKQRRQYEKNIRQPAIRITVK